jgi:hypothetical protein
MAKILCSLSGIEYNCDHFPVYIQSLSHHPIFDLPLKKLWKFYPKWQEGALTETDSYLLTLSILNATELVDFRMAAQRHANTHAIVQRNMELLYDTVGRIVTIKHPAFVLPRFVISKDTRTLENLKVWLDIWNDKYADFQSGLKDQELRSKLERREASLARLIRNPAIKPERYAHILAGWAEEAAEFPTFTFTHPNGSTTTIAEYWKQIIIDCYRAENIIQHTEKDIVECLEHCEEYIDLGSIFSYQLFNTLREGLDAHRGFFGLGTTSFSILNDGDNVGDSNLQLLIADAPTKEPARREYPTEFAYLKAKMKWNLSIQHIQSVQGAI